jgi:hypothetical protein
MESSMRTFIALLVMVYLIGVGVVLAPTVSGKWNSGTPAELSASIVQQAPLAFAWPVTAYHRMVDEPIAPPVKG